MSDVKHCGFQERECTPACSLMIVVQQEDAPDINECSVKLVAIQLNQLPDRLPFIMAAQRTEQPSGPQIPIARIGGPPR